MTLKHQRGETNAPSGYDYRRRVVQTTTVPQNGGTLTSKNCYVNNLLFAIEDAYGRKQYRAYRASDTTLIRTVDATVPEFSLASFDAVLNQTRNLNANAQYLVTDSLPNAAGPAHIKCFARQGLAPGSRCSNQRFGFSL